MRQLTIILFLLFFFTGCGSISDRAGVFLYTDNRPAQQEKVYQYSAPWDQDLYDGFYKRVALPTERLGLIKGGIVPHHLLAGHISASFFETIARQKPSTIVLVGPNHFDRGTSGVITTMRDWQTMYGSVQTNREVVQTFVENEVARVDEAVVKEEHAIYSLIPFIKKSTPNASVVPLILANDVSERDVDRLVDALVHTLPDDAVFVASIDFSHYQTFSVAEFHDALSRGVIRASDTERVHQLEIDSVPSLSVLLRLMDRFGTQHIAYELHANSAALVGAYDTRETTSYYSPYFTFGDPDTARTASLLHVGDIMLDRAVAGQIRASGPSVLLDSLAGREGRFFSGFDAAVGNLEGPFVQHRRDTSKEIAFRFDPTLTDFLTDYRFSILNLANNHSLDMGSDGFAESQKHLDEAGIAYFGKQYGIDQSSALIRSIGGMQIGFVGFNDTNQPVDLELAGQVIEDLKKRVDRIVVNVHWGQEYALLKSNIRQQTLARAFIDAGADVVVGHHPHVIQEIEIYKDRPIFYSLGNFIFDQYWSEPTQIGLAIGLVFHDTEAISAYLFPVEGQASRVKLMEYHKARQLLDQLIDGSRFGGYTVSDFSFTITSKR